MRYIGSKANLLDEINSILEPHLSGKESIFVDLFAGSNSVGKFFKNRFKIISNDLMYFSYVIAKANIELNEAPVFEKLKQIGIDDPFKYLQSQRLDEYQGSFVTENYSPAGKAGRMYFTESNAKRIDYIRTKIDEWFGEGLITESEMFYLLDALIQAVPFVSNITGTYGAYLKHWDKRALKNLELIPSSVIDNGMSNVSYNQDANKLIKGLSGDILYIDTPYNNRQYAPNYHVLETIARNDSPDVHGVTGQRDTQNLKSDYAMKSKAKTAMSDLLKDLNFSHVVMSYSTDGIIPEEELINLISSSAKFGKVEVKRIAYRKYKSKVGNKGNQLYELLFYFQPKNAKFEKTNRVQRGSSVGETKSIKKTTGGGFIKSPMNYIGGKYKLLPQLFPLFPKKIDIFVDLFSGGSNVGINVDARKVYFNDLNVKINEVFRYFQGKTPQEVLDKIQLRIDEYELSKTNEEGFLKFRADYNENPTPLDLYTLVSFSFNYQFRFNNNMQYNNPFGRNRSHFSERMASNLTKFVTRLNDIDATFTDKYFTEFDTSMLTNDSFVYADPPYFITTGSYNDGNRGFVNWTQTQEQELYNFLDELNSRGIKFAMSNVTDHKGRSNDMLKEWSKKYHVIQLDYDYKNASHNTVAKDSTEVLIINYEF